MVKNIVVFFIIVASAYFYKFVYIPGQIGLLLSFGANCLMLLTIIITIIYDRGKGFKQSSGILIGLMLFSVLLSVYGAKWGHNQNFLLTLWAANSMFFYLFYFFLHAMRIRPSELERLFIIAGILFIIIYYIQYALYPNIFFGGRASEDRGTIRIFIPGGSFAAFMYYYFLQKTFTTDKKIFAIYCIVLLGVPILQGTRSSIITQLLGTLIFILLSKQVKSKILASTLIFFSGILVFFIFQDIIVNLIEVSKSQASQDDDDIRVKCTKFFLYEFPPTKLNYLIGNGDPHGASSYGIKDFYYKTNFQFYRSDIGFIGEYITYGVLYVICVFLILRKFFITKIESRYSYIKFWAFIEVLSAITGGAFSRSTEIIVITSILYIYDISSFELKHPDTRTEEKLVPD
jgi:hypothetical protein